MGFIDKLKQGASKATEMAQQTVEITRLNSAVSAKRKDIEKWYADMGEAVYQAYERQDLSSAEPVVVDMSRNIQLNLEEIAKLEEQIRQVKNEKVCICGSVVLLDAKFCSGCGHRFEEAEAARKEPTSE